MTTVTDFRKRLALINVETEAEGSVLDTRDTIIEKQRNQLLHGFRADDTPIGRYRSHEYAQLKHDLNPLAGFGNMDWKLTGSLHNKVFVKVNKSVYDIFSADSKTQKLVARLGDPFGLSKQSQSEWVDETLHDVFIKRMKTAIGV
jgi:hypothetical protein